MSKRGEAETSAKILAFRPARRAPRMIQVWVDAEVWARLLGASRALSPGRLDPAPAPVAAQANAPSQLRGSRAVARLRRP